MLADFHYTDLRHQLAKPGLFKKKNKTNKKNKKDRRQLFGVNQTRHGENQRQ